MKKSKSVNYSRKTTMLGSAPGESGEGGYQIAFNVDFFGYLIGITTIHMLVPKMKPLTKI